MTFKNILESAHQNDEFKYETEMEDEQEEERTSN